MTQGHGQELSDECSLQKVAEWKGGAPGGVGIRLQLEVLSTPSTGGPSAQGAHGEGGLHDDRLPAPWDPRQLFPHGRGQPCADPG